MPIVGGESGGSAIIEVANYSALPAANTVGSELYAVLASQGTAWLPGSLGGTYYPKGLYYSDGSDWIFTETPYNANLATVDAGTNDSTFVTPYTFTNAAKWGTKEPTIAVGTTAQYLRGDKTWQTLDTSIVPENTNLYFTTTRAIGSTLTGYISGAGVVAATDTILQAIQKLNGNVAAIPSYTFSTGLTNTANTITNNLVVGVSGGQTIIGGTGVGDGITYKGTTGNGTSTVAAHSFVVGNNGGTIALNILNNGNVKIVTGYVGIATDAVTNQPITSSFSLNGQLISRFINTNSSGAAISSIATQNNSGQSQSCNKLGSAYTTAGLLVASLNWYHGNVGSTLYSNSASSTAHIWSIGGTAAANEVMRIESTAFTLANAVNIVVGTTTGTKIGTSTSQKLSMWNATPIVQPTTGIAAATFVTNTSGIVNDTATFDGYTIGQVVKALRNIGALA